MGLINNIKDRFKNEEFTVAPNKKLKTISAEFKKTFGVSLVFYKGVQIADEEMTLNQLDLRTTKKVVYSKGGLEIKASMKVSEVRDLFDETFGVKVQIKDKDAKILVPKNITIGQAAREEYDKDAFIIPKSSAAAASKPAAAAAQKAAKPAAKPAAKKGKERVTIGEYVIEIQNRAVTVSAIPSSAKAALRECAKKQGMKFSDSNETTQSLGKKLLKAYCGGASTGTIGDYHIKCDADGHIDVRVEYRNAIATLRGVTKLLKGFTWEDKWTTYEAAAKIIDYAQAHPERVAK